MSAGRRNGQPVPERNASSVSGYRRAFGPKFAPGPVPFRFAPAGDAPELSLRLVRTMQKKPTGPLGWFTGNLSEEEFLAAMVDEKRLVYEFDVLRAYGMR
jgi:hypothetical protein